MTDKERQLYADIFGIDVERVLGCRRWVWDGDPPWKIEAEIWVQGVTEEERVELSARLPSGWNVVA